MCANIKGEENLCALIDYYTLAAYCLLQVLKELSPQVIFSAHEHKAMHISLDTATDQLSDIWILPPYETPLYQLRMDVGDIHEVLIPTCSYRMGTLHMGYGLAYIGRQRVRIIQYVKIT